MKRTVTMLLIMLVLIVSLGGCEQPCAHDYSTTVVSATCQSEEYTLYECKYCGDSYKSNYGTLKGNHVGVHECTICKTNYYTMLASYAVKHGSITSSTYLFLLYSNYGNKCYLYFNSSNCSLRLILDDSFGVFILELNNSDYFDWTYGYNDYVMSGSSTRSSISTNTKSLSYSNTNIPSYTISSAVELATTDCKMVLLMADVGFSLYDMKITVANLGFANIQE